jgi:antitoxin ParD1/3/4
VAKVARINRTVVSSQFSIEIHINLNLRDKIICLSGLLQTDPDTRRAVAQSLGLGGETVCPTLKAFDTRDTLGLRTHMNIHLTPDLEQFVQNKVRFGGYNSASEVVREALRLLEQRDEVFTLRKDEIRKQIEDGWQSAKRAELVDGDEVFDRIDAEVEALERSDPK